MPRQQQQQIDKASIQQQQQQQKGKQKWLGKKPSKYSVCDAAIATVGRDGCLVSWIGRLVCVVCCTVESFFEKSALI